jgi:hypothetical protein
MFPATNWKKIAATMITRKFLGYCRSVSGNLIYHRLHWHLGVWRSIYFRGKYHQEGGKIT